MRYLLAILILAVFTYISIGGVLPSRNLSVKEHLGLGDYLLAFLQNLITAVATDWGSFDGDVKTLNPNP